ncbi:filamentous hemagglutinin N-terminal domain-containing protein [Arsenophonus sp. aPb]|uniref:filamentous hemagglutinin N-terminal domain-containing protein n=1 Tax=Arsenophonus sp. aPb TaxID=3041619 RepID=UPI00246898E1|nr:filamentous hemagglutinin N-terminal domain-containing protein [Arsenophonus sp. aPb]WGL97890.1 filamentous hemagglutinin N-terminal domain-containing protein [Arsenophonus sp. aPb]
MKNKIIRYSTKIVYLIACYLLLPVFGSAIQPANDKTQLTVENQIPIINIAAPNQAGISYNRYQQFNIPPQGAVLNNAIRPANSQLVGQLAKNDQLAERAARLIINVVTGSSSSQLNGKLEIAGRKADVIIANPNGISCDGCHFSNIGGLTLTTGQPALNQRGEFAHLRVKKGDISILNKGLYSGSQDYAELISRTVTINASILGKTISLLPGTNAINYQTGTVSQITSPDLKPQFAVNITEPGGIYANRVKIIATESDGEVKLDNIKTSERDLFVSAKGKLTLGHITTKGLLTAKAPAVIIPATSEILSKQDLLVESDSLINQGKITAQQNMRLFSNIIRNQGESAKIEAYNNLWLQKNAQGEPSEKIESNAAAISTHTGNLVLKAKQVIN